MTPAGASALPTLLPASRDAIALRWRRLAGALARPSRPIAPATAAAGGILVAGIVLVDIIAVMLVVDPLALGMLPDLPAWIVRAGRRISNLGDSAFYLVPCGLALIVLGLWPPALPRRVEAALGQVWLRLAFFFVAVAGTGIVVNVGKRLIGRVRPLHLDDGAVWQFAPLGWRSSAASFPSGHATTAFAVTTALVLLCPAARRWRAALILVPLAVLVCASRVVIGAHFVSDVLAGALFGALSTWWLAHVLARRGLVFRLAADGALAPRGAGASKTLRAGLAARSRVA